jgi:hypothetical protein
LEQGKEVKYLRIFSLSLTLLSLNACRTDGVFVKETPLNISETRTAIAAVVGQPRLVDKSGRHLDSKYFDKNEKLMSSPERGHERRSAHITIVGDRRPYDIEVQVFIENLSENGDYEKAGEDPIIAKNIADRIKKQLYQSLDESNPIDALRSF